MKRLFTFILLLILGGPAFAYITGAGSNKFINVMTRTHIIIVGRGTDLGDSLARVAGAQAKKYVELYPNEQVYLLSANETDTDDDLSGLQEFGFFNLMKKGSSFDSPDVLTEMLAFNKIASVDVFSHSVAYYGVILDGKLNRLDPKADGYQKLLGHFTADAFAFLHGCNSGQFLAGIFSYQWAIPVAGSFTGTDFQFIYENHQFHNDDERKPKGFGKVTVNSQTYEKNVGCYTGACMRLFPDNHSYNGFWGSFNEGGLGFYKWLCINSTITSDRCFKTMAKAALSYVSVKSINGNSSLQDYKDVVLDFLCPADKRAECHSALENAIATGNMEYDSFGGKSLQCDFKGCKAKFTCERVPFINLLKSGSCQVENLRTSNKTTTMANEYAAYLKGFKLLQAELAIKK
jgi:hypothetical protein